MNKTESGLSTSAVDIEIKEYNQNNEPFQDDGKVVMPGDEIITYKVFSVYKTTKDDDYITRNFDNFNKKVKELQEKSEVEFNQDVSKTSQIITLSTCHDNNVDRIVVHGYKN